MEAVYDMAVSWFCNVVLQQISSKRIAQKKKEENLPSNTACARMNQRDTFSFKCFVSRNSLLFSPKNDY